MMLLQVTQDIKTGSSFFESIQNPILGLFLLSLLTAIIFLWRKVSKKETEIQELNNAILKKSVNDIDLFHEVEATIETFVSQNKRIEDLADKHQDLLREIKYKLDSFINAK